MVSGFPAGGAMDGIVLNNATGEVRNNVVEGYAIAYGGWAMGNVWFHDNISRNSIYGFNADSYTNNGIILQSNQFIHSAAYGVVIGGGTQFSHWNVSNNTIQMNATGSYGIILRGQVQSSVFTQNTIQSDGGHNQTAIFSFPAGQGQANVDNSFQDNHIDGSLLINFSQDPDFSTNCRYLNRDLQDRPLRGFPDNSGSQCRQ